MIDDDGGDIIQVYSYIQNNARAVKLSLIFKTSSCVVPCENWKPVCESKYNIHFYTLIEIKKKSGKVSSA